MQPSGRAPIQQQTVLIHQHIIQAFKGNACCVQYSSCSSLCVLTLTHPSDPRPEQRGARMSRNNGKASKLEFLRLGLSRARGGGSSTTTRPGGDNSNRTSSPRRVSSSSSSTASPPSSCVSSEGSPEAAAPPGGGGAAPTMVLAGCPRCMMYVMLSREDPRCPRCLSAVLLDFNDDDQSRPRQRR
jgi:hypothetical protein